MPAVAASDSASASAASNTGCLSSCMSFAYASGSPFITVSNPISAPAILPVFARTSSAASGFFFAA